MPRPFPPGRPFAGRAPPTVVCAPAYMGARHRHRATCLALVRAPAYMGARFGGCVPVPAARGNHVQPLPRRVTGIYSSIPGSRGQTLSRRAGPPVPAARACNRCVPGRLLPGRPATAARACNRCVPGRLLPGRPAPAPWLAAALAGLAFLTYVNNQYSTFMPYVKNDPALFPIPALPSSRSHHIPHPMPGRGQAEGAGKPAGPAMVPFACRAAAAALWAAA